MEQEIKNLFYELGTPIFIVKKTKSINCEVYHCDVASIKHLSMIDKNIKTIAQFTKKSIAKKKSDIAHFAISIPITTSNKVKLLDTKYKKVFDKGLNIFAGIDEDGSIRTINMEDVPHILVSGMTGSGKSVMINSIICSLLKQKKYKLNFSFIDTKRVELSPYKKLGGLWCEVATTSINALDTLKNICDDLESRYVLMEKNGWRKIPDYYYRRIVVIEELGDLMLSSNGVVEKFIVKIAQLGRACGIHLVIATQRPTVDVVTGEIKANIGCRFALQTTSAIDSRNILGHNGAEKLKGNGDCLLKLPTLTEEIHLQCPFVGDDDIQKTIKEFLSRGD